VSSSTPRVRIPFPVVALLAVVSCGGRPWSVSGAPDVPPDMQFRTGVEAGEDIYVWNCFRGHRVVVRQFSSACFGSRAPVMERGACGARLASEAHDPDPSDGGYSPGMPDDYRWPGSPPAPPYEEAQGPAPGDAGDASAPKR
jgi:hypothetical protein